MKVINFALLWDLAQKFESYPLYHALFSLVYPVYWLWKEKVAQDLEHQARSWRVFFVFGQHSAQDTAAQTPHDRPVISCQWPVAWRPGLLGPIVHGGRWAEHGSAASWLVGWAPTPPAVRAAAVYGIHCCMYTALLAMALALTCLDRSNNLHI